MSVAEKKKHYSVAEYLAMEVMADHRSEYFDGEIYAMSGGTLNHSRICRNIARTVEVALDGTSCEVFGQDLAVWLQSENSFVYPDLSVVCGPPEVMDKTNRQITNPFLIVEVLSESTEAFDRGGKFRMYRTLESLKSYVLIDQWDAIVEVYRQDKNGEWRFHSYNGMDSSIHLPNLNVELTLADIYRRVDFEPRKKLKASE